ncbi:S8 family serine peptidase [Nucisporomicrobium flavum]|uniref:S8 family serine peptidase n=1 Tax=Nucisporomicrobium flavum TaxID=2785915 RepID=UPI0018F4052B|nr:S8 family serine peptidase [Nucisporomicrobium flavum]
MRAGTRRWLTTAVAGGVIVLGAATPAVAADGETADTYATIVDPSGRPTYVEVEAPTAAQEIRRAESLPGSVGAAVETPVTITGAASADPLRSLQWDNDALRLDAITPRPAVAGQLVAVIDTGVSAAEEDWASGQVRCDLGTDVVGDAYTASSGGTGCVDPHGHGTHVAGTVGAVAGNGIGMAGVAGGVQILPVRALDASGSGGDVDIARGLVWAVDHGATVINMSIGGPQSGAYDAAVAYAAGHRVPVVVANGNNRLSGNAPQWPAAAPGVIAVAATEAGGDSAYYSNSSGTALIAAPGSRILSMDARHTTPGTPYVYMSGTSMASPHVAAIAALWLAAHPAGTVEQLRDALIATATDLGTSGFDDLYGYGLVNPYELLTPAPEPVVEDPEPAPAPAPVVDEPAPVPSLVAPEAPASVQVVAQTEALRVTWTAVAGTDTAPVEGYRVYRNGTLRATLAGTSFTDPVDGGVAYTYAVEAFGAGGTSARVSAVGTARWAAAGLSVNRTSVLKKGRIVVRGTSLRPGSTVVVRETYAYRKSTRTVVLASVRVSAGDNVSFSVLPVQGARTGTLSLQAVDHNGRVLRAGRSIRVG